MKCIPFVCPSKMVGRGLRTDRQTNSLAHSRRFNDRQTSSINYITFVCPFVVIGTGGLGWKTDRRRGFGISRPISYRTYDVCRTKNDESNTTYDTTSQYYRVTMAVAMWNMAACACVGGRQWIIARGNRVWTATRDRSRERQRWLSLDWSSRITK